MNECLCTDDLRPCNMECLELPEPDDGLESVYDMGGLTKWGLPPRQSGGSKSPNQPPSQSPPQVLAPNVGSPTQLAPQFPNPMSRFSSRQALPVEKQSDPIIGYRTWVVGESLTDLGLYAANTQYGPWQPGKQHAVCKVYNDHNAPEDKCHCGFYLCRTPLDATRHIIPSGQNVVIGVCVAWGQIIEYPSPDGWRCSDVKILALIQWDKAVPEQLNRLEWIARFYGVPLVKNADALKALATEMYG